MTPTQRCALLNAEMAAEGVLTRPVPARPRRRSSSVGRSNDSFMTKSIGLSPHSSQHRQHRSSSPCFCDRKVETCLTPFAFGCIPT